MSRPLGLDTADAATPSGGGRPDWRGGADRRWLVALVVVPTVLFLVPALLGHPSIDADNLIQNFPLRVLAGRQIASGHLPLLDPLTNGGTPLLGGMNAGALYPLTLLFAFLPPLVAWTINLIAVYATAGIGVYALARTLRLRATASGIAALVYAYGGAMIGQIVHLGVVQGFALLPWALVLLVGLGRRLQGLDARAPLGEIGWGALPYALGIALLWGLTFLTGEPRAIADVELLFVIAVPATLILSSSYRPSGPRRVMSYLATIAVGFAGGVGIGLVQLLPGWSFITVSERHAVSYQFFGAGSLAVRWALLLVNPDLFGGNGSFHQVGYFSNYNLPEVTGYVGVVALVALFAYLTRLTRRGWTGHERDLTLYVVLLVVGLFATWGNFTPVGHLFRALPLFGSTRLQSRNVIFVDLALAMLLAWWLDRLGQGDRRGAGLGPVARWFTALAALGTAGFALAEWIDGPAVVRWVGMTDGQEALARGLYGADAVHLGIALVAAAGVIALARTRVLSRVLIVVTILDLVAFSMFTSTGLVGGAGPREASRAHAAAVLGTSGRFALVDLSGTHTGPFRALGQPNMNVFTGLASVQGYGSLISTFYDDETGTHPQNGLDPCALATGVFTQLRLETIAVATEMLAVPEGATPSPPSSCTGFSVAPSARRYFGQVLDVNRVALSAPAGHTLSRGPMTLHLLGARGGVVRTLVVTAKRAHVVVIGTNTPIAAAGLEVSASGGVDVEGVTVRAAGAAAGEYQLDDRFDTALSNPYWRLVATHGTYSVFKAQSIPARAWVASGRGRVTGVRTAPWGDAWVDVAASGPVTVRRSAAYLPGWRATAVNDVTGTTRELHVFRRGLTEAVDVPRGRWTIHFHYHAPYIELSVAVSLAATVVWAGILSGWWVRRRVRGKVAP